MMHKFQTILFLAFAQFVLAQNVLLNKVEKVNDNKDKFLYFLSEKNESSEYLGEVEVQGFTKDDAEIFSAIYKKAKEVGANSYSFKPFEKVDGTLSAFDPVHYRLSLYYTEKKVFDAAKGMVYVFASSDKDQKISINGKDYLLAPRSYVGVPIAIGDVHSVSTKKLLGSTIKFQPKKENSSYYFQVSSSKVKADDTGFGGLNLKSGDIIGLEASYGDFLRAIYQKQ